MLQVIYRKLYQLRNDSCGCLYTGIPEGLHARARRATMSSRVATRCCTRFEGRCRALSVWYTCGNLNGTRSGIVGCFHSAFVLRVCVSVFRLPVSMPGGGIRSLKKDVQITSKEPRYSLPTTSALLSLSPFHKASSFPPAFGPCKGA